MERVSIGSTLAACPDCGDERVLVEVTASEYCCTACDAAVFLVDQLAA